MSGSILPEMKGIGGDYIYLRELWFGFDIRSTALHGKDLDFFCYA